MSGTALRYRDAVVWKYAIPMPDARCRSFIDAHHSAVLLSVAIVNDVMVAYVLAWPERDPDEHEEDHGLIRLIVANTGADIPDFPDGARFLGTLETNGIVWHVWNGDEETTA